MRTTIKRRQLLLGGAAAAGAASLIRSRGEAAEFTYKLAYGDLVGVPRDVRMVQMVHAIKAETNGRMDIQIFPHSILGSNTAMLSQLRLGSIQFLSTLDGVYSAVVPLVSIASVGFAFSSEKQPCRIMDGDFGDYVRAQFAPKGLYVFKNVIEAGFRQMTTWSKPIKTADDFVGLKLRVPSANIYIDMFKTLGASPIPLDSNELYVSLQTHLVDGEDGPLDVVESYRLYEVQKYLSMTGHVWSGYWFTANLDAWNALPPDIKAVIERNAAKYTKLERNDYYLLTASLTDKLKRQGLTINTLDTTGMRARLKPYYARWKNEFGPTAWGLLESKVGKLG